VNRQGTVLYLLNYSVVWRLDLVSGLIEAIAKVDGNPSALALDAAGVLYVADHRSKVWKVDGTSVAGAAFAGSGVLGNTGDGGVALKADLGWPIAIATDNRYLYIGDQYYNVIRRVDLSSSIITTYAGSHLLGYGGDGGLATQALVLSPNGHVEHHLTLTDDGTAVWIHVEPGTAGPLLAFLESMRFLLRVDPADVRCPLRPALRIGVGLPHVRHRGRGGGCGVHAGCFPSALVWARSGSGEPRGAHPCAAAPNAPVGLALSPAACAALGVSVWHGQLPGGQDHPGQLGPLGGRGHSNLAST